VPGGLINSEEGTSASGPIWAAYTAILNQASAEQGIPAVGNLNGALYQIAASPQYESLVHDIQTGSNVNACGTGYSATQGWDAVTGLGTPTCPLISAVSNLVISSPSAVLITFNATGFSPTNVDSPADVTPLGISFNTAGSNIGNGCSKAAEVTPESLNAPTCPANFPVGAPSGSFCITPNLQELLITLSCTSTASGVSATSFSQEFGCPNNDNNGAWISAQCAPAASGAGVDVTISAGLSTECDATGPNVDVQTLTFNNVTSASATPPQEFPGNDTFQNQFVGGSLIPGEICGCLADICPGSGGCNGTFDTCAYDSFVLGETTVQGIGGI
jgi:hypothetical protein